MKVFKTATLKVRNADGEFVSFPALRGETSYDIAVANGYEGTQEEWLNMMTDENGWITRYYELEESKANKKDVYTAKQIDELLAPVMSDVEDAIDTGSYHAFVAAINEDTISAAFGKNNEDLIKNIGRQMAMYAWFKGEDKVQHPFVDLMRMSTLNDMTYDTYEEIIESDAVSSLVTANEYAKDKVFEIIEDNIFVGTNSDYFEDTPLTSVKTINVTNEDLSSPFRISYETEGSSNDVDGLITINGVELLHCKSGDNIPVQNKLYNWSDFGITTAGTYEIIMSGYRRYGQSASINISLSLYKAKQSYSESEE